jgi:hypothetical protein
MGCHVPFHMQGKIGRDALTLRENPYFVGLTTSKNA